MDAPNYDTWTHAHDLTLVFLALAYSTDSKLSNDEVDAISDIIARWRPEASRPEVHEIVLESIAAYLQSDAEEEVVRSVRSLEKALTIDKRREALEDAMRIAEADGILLNSEQNILSIVASIWDIRATRDRLLEETLVEIEARPEWTILHDIAFLFIVMAHGADGEVADEEIAVIVDRVSSWAPDMTDSQVREVVRAALTYYSGGAEAFDMEAAIDSIGHMLPRAQRLVVLDDLLAIAEADGDLRQAEKDIIETLSRAWHVDVRVSPLS